MKKNNIKKLSILLALAQVLTLSGCKGNTNTQNSSSFLESKIEYWYDGEGQLHGRKEVAPIVTYTIEPVTSIKIVNGKAEKVTTYVQRTIYEAPSCATRVEGTGANMRCFIDYGMRPIQSQKIVDGKTEDVITYSFGVMPENLEEENGPVLHR